MNKIIILILSVIVFPVYGQNLQHNLEKYGYYRQRLREKFVYVTPIDTVRGGNIPLAEYNKEDMVPYGTGDGNGTLQYYIGMLATEYRLLKDYGQDYSQTLNELIYALKAFERLDATAESYYRPNHEVLPEDLNGFFIREDFYKNFARKEGNYLPNFDCAEDIRAMSMDNTWHYLLNLALAKQLVDDDLKFTDADGSQVTVSECVDKIVDRMMNTLSSRCVIEYSIPVNITIPMPWPFHNIHFTHTYTVCMLNWALRNPVTNTWVPIGRFPFVYSPGFANAAKSITGKDYNDFTTLIWGPNFNELVMFLRNNYNNFAIYDLLSKMKITYPLVFYVPTPFGSKQITINKKISLLPFAPIFFSWFQDHTKLIKDIYDLSVFITLSERSYFPGEPKLLTLTDICANASILHNQLSYEHIPLIYLVLHGDGTEPLFNLTEPLAKQLLDNAPDCGPYNYGTASGSDFSNDWSSSNALIWPENSGINSGWHGDFNGIDYMLLHNLYWLVYADKKSKNRYIHETYAQVNGFSIVGSFWNPLTISAENNIIADNYLTSIADVTYNAGNEVILAPGFETSEGAEFEAVGNGIGAGSIDYKYIAYHPDCSFRDNYKAYIDTLHRQVQKPDTTSYDNEITSFTADTVFITLSDEDIQDLKNNNSENINVSGSESSNNSSEIFVSPNPNNGKFSIMIPQNQSTATMSVSDMLGNVILSKQFTGQFAEADISAFAGGVYLLKINAEGRVYTQKIVFRKE
jgi:hypothetical protein